VFYTPSSQIMNPLTQLHQFVSLASLYQCSCSSVSYTLSNQYPFIFINKASRLILSDRSPQPIRRPLTPTHLIPPRPLVPLEPRPPHPTPLVLTSLPRIKSIVLHPHALPLFRAHTHRLFFHNRQPLKLLLDVSGMRRWWWCSQ
jgi:hypothetical protein